MNKLIDNIINDIIKNLANFRAWYLFIAIYFSVVGRFN